MKRRGLTRPSYLIGKSSKEEKRLRYCLGMNLQAFMIHTIIIILMIIEILLCAPIIIVKALIVKAPIVLYW